MGRNGRIAVVSVLAIALAGGGGYGLFRMMGSTPPPAPAPAPRVIHELPKLAEGQVYDLIFTHESELDLDSGRVAKARTFVRPDERTCSVPETAVVYDGSLRLNTMVLTREAVPAVMVTGTVYREGFERLRLHYRVVRTATVSVKTRPHLKVTSCW